MTEYFARSVLRVSLAQICQNLGWNCVNSSPLEILVDILHRYLRTLAKSTHTFAEHYNRTEPNLDDLGLAFKEMGISLAELEEYVNNVEPVPFVHSVPRFPFQRNNKFHFPKEGSREVQQRPEWINSHLPLMYPEVEDEEPVFSPDDVMDIVQPCDGTNGFTAESGSPHNSPRPGSRRLLEVAHDANFPTPKRQRLQSDEESGRPFREVIGVTMTAAGIISPVVEGRLPDTCMPSRGFDDSLPNSPIVAPMSPSTPLPVTPTCDNVEEMEEMEEVVVEVKETVKSVTKKEDVVKVKKPPKVKEPKKVKKDNKENKKKKDLKLQLAKKHTAKLKCIGKSSKHKGGPAEAGSSLLKTPKLGRPKGKSNKNKTDKSAKKVSADVPLDLSKTPTKQPKKPKSPKVPKPKTKSPKAEKQIPGGQLASLLAKVSGIKVEKGAAESVKTVQNLAATRDLDGHHHHHQLKEWPDLVSAENSPERLVIDDNDDVCDPRDKTMRLASLDACINAVIQRGLQDGGPLPLGSAAHSSHSRSDVEMVSSIPAKIKLEPRDVYDFTDDDDEDVDKDDGVCVDTGILAISSLVSPRKKKSEEKSERSKDTKKTKSKSKDSEKKLKGKNKTKSPKHVKTDTELDFIKHPPRTPEVRDDDSDSEFYGRLQATPMMMGLGSSSFTSSMNPFHPLSQIPPALLPFPMPVYPGSTPPSAAGGSSVSPRSQVPYPKLVDLADVAISKARHDGDFDLGRSKEKEKERERDKKKEKREKREKEKLKSKKKKDKLKEKSSGKGASDKERDKSKSKKDKVLKMKGKDRKEEKAKEKDKKKDKAKEKEKLKEKKPEKKKSKEKGFKKEKTEKPTEDIESDSAAPSTSSAIPRLTFKLGSSSSATDVPKIVIKNISVDSPSCSPVPPKEVSPPPPPSRAPPASPLLPVSQGSSSGKSHPKPQSKVQPVPPAPARTVITETVGTIIDDSGAKIWICPACTHPDDGSPMIGCDECDEWYHWVCVNIVVPPKEEEEWFCTRCLARKQTPQRRKKHRKEK